MSQLPKGRAMRASVAQAIGASEVPGVHRITPDPHDDRIVYVACSADAWATLQHRAAQHLGVQHTGALREVTRAALWASAELSAPGAQATFLTTMRCVRSEANRSELAYYVDVTVTTDGHRAWGTALTADKQQAQRWERWLYNHADEVVRALREQDDAALCDVSRRMILDTCLAPRVTHTQWMSRNPTRTTTDHS